MSKREVSRSILAGVLSAGICAGAAGFAVGARGGTAPAGAAPAATGWAATATKALPLQAASMLGAAPAAMPLSVSVVLAVPDPAALSAAAAGTGAASPALTPAEVAARFGPSPAEASAVAGWLAGAGFRDVAVEPDRLLVDAQGDAATAERAFGTRLDLFRWDGAVVYANTAPALVPARFGGAVLSVLGLSDVPMNLPLTHRSGAPAPAVEAQIARLATTVGQPDLNGFTPQQLARIYDASSMPSGTGTSVAVVVSGNMTPTINDLRYAESVDHAPQAAVSVVYVGAEKSIVDNNPNTGNLEWDLDTQMSTMIAGDVQHEYLYDVATATDANVARAINAFVEQDRAVAGSASLGLCDAVPFLDGSMAAADESLAEGVLQHQTFFSSTGDNGFACPEVVSTGVPGGVPGDSWPADGKWTTAVGGTSLLATAAGSYEEELAWIGGGGGVSEFEQGGAWTDVANPAARAPAGGRGIPDVAADADANVSPAIVWQGHAKNFVGGTSVASPLVMGLWARIQTSHGNRLGDASLAFYRLYNKINKPGSQPKSPSGFHDVVLGTNGLWTALPGYDLTTGIGSSQTAVLNRAL